MNKFEKVLVIGLSKSRELAKQAAEFANVEYHEPSVKNFADGET